MSTKKQLFLFLSIGLMGTKLTFVRAEMLLNTIVVTGNADNAQEATTLTTTQIESQTLERQTATNLRTALKDIPGVSVDSDRSGQFSNVRIRGLGGDRVALTVDGVSLPSAYSFGAYLNVGRGYFDIDHLKSIQIIKGSSSTLFGSGALAGAVMMTTKDPEDYLTGDKTLSGMLKTGYASDQKAWFNAGSIAYKLNEDWSTLFTISTRNGKENQNHSGFSGIGNLRTRPDPQDQDTYNLMGKVVYAPNDLHKITLSYEKFNTDIDTHQLSRYNTTIMNSPVKLFDASVEDKQNRHQFSLKYEFNLDSAWMDEGLLQAYWQNTKARQNTSETRFHPQQQALARKRFSLFDQKQYGLDAQFKKQWLGEKFTHDIVYGASYTLQDLHTLRLGDTRQHSTGQSVETEIFPTQGFPDSRVHNTALFVQDSIHLNDSPWVIVPGLRYDTYRLSPKSSDYYLSGNPGTKDPVSLNKGQLSKKIALLYTPNHYTTWRLSYSEGFKSPSFSAVNVGFSNAAIGYTALANPNLKPETSRSYELGVEWDHDIYQAGVNIFYNQYNDFIEELSSVGRDPQTGWLLFQSKNLSKAVIKGAEAHAAISLNEFWTLPADLKLHASIAYAKGDNRQDKQPIDSVDPLNGMLGLSYEAEDHYALHTRWYLYKGKDDLSQSLKDSGIKNVPGHGQLDIYGYYKPTENLTLTAGAYNITDQKYWHYGQLIRQSQTDDAALMRVTAPGRNFALSVKYDF